MNLTGLGRILVKSVYVQKKKNCNEINLVCTINHRPLTGVIRGFCLEAEPNSAEDEIATEEKLPCGRLLMAWAVPGVNVLLE